MTRKIEVRPATLRDASYVMACLRPQDRAEVLCQVPDGTKMHELAYQLLMGSEAYCATFNDQPAMFFGVSPINVACLSVWALGTRHMIRVTPAVTRFFADELLPAKIDEGYHTMEARSLIDHTLAHRWITGAGGRASGEPFIFGKNREKFLLFRWTADSFEANKAQYRRAP